MVTSSINGQLNFKAKSKFQDRIKNQMLFGLEA
jgi:hypothetical protein